MAILRNDFSLLLSIEGKCEPSLEGVPRVSGMTECEQKSKPKKFLGPLKAKKFLDQKFPPLPPPKKKIPCRISKPFKFPESIKWYDTIKLVVNFSQNYSARIRGHYHESSDFFNTPKSPLLNYKNRAWEWETQVTFLFDSSYFTSGWRIPGGEWSVHFFPVLFRGLCGRKFLPSSVLIIPVLAKQKALCQKNSLAIWIFNNYSTSARWLWVGYN